MKRTMAILTLLGFACAASAWRSIWPADPLTTFHQDVIRSAKGYDTNEMLLQGVGGWFTYHEIYNGLMTQVGCGCALKGGDPTQLYAPVPEPQDVYLWGDSLTRGIETWIPQGASPLEAYNIYYPAFRTQRIRNNAFPGSTSQVLRAHFDRCAEGNYRSLYPNPPGDPGGSNHIQLEYSRATLLIGGNDFVQYEQLFRAVPWLTIFRINNVVNNQNRIVTYHQAQGAEIMILSQQPHPSMDYTGWASHVSGLAELERLQSQIRSNYGTTIAALPVAAVGASFVNQCLVHTTCVGGAAIATGAAVGAAVIFAHGIISHNASVGAYARGVSNILFGRNLGKQIYIDHYGWVRQDFTWASMQLGPLSLATYALVANARNTRFVNTWAAFADPPSFLAGRWWVGNPALYIGPYDLPQGPLGGGEFGDSVHYNALGHGMLHSTVQSEMVAAGWLNRSRPVAANGERCFKGAGFTAQTGTPANWTEEPPELPGLTDEQVWLLILCIFLGHCTP